MNQTRRRLLGAATAFPVIYALEGCGGAAVPQTVNRFRRIAIEEHYMIPEIAAEWRKMLAAGAVDEPGFRLIAESVYANNTPAMQLVNKRLADLDEGRLTDMDALGVDVQVLSIGAPGVQVLDGALAVELARVANDRLAAAIRTHPQRFAGLAAVAPQRPEESARELERAVRELGLRGAIISSHTKGEYLDDQKFWPMFEAAESLGVPIYLHPRDPSAGMLQAYLDYHLYFAGWGFAAETGLHALRLIFGGVFERFPKLKIILGHMGEGVPYWFERIDSYHLFLAGAGTQKRLPRLPSEYFKENFVVTTSGMNSRIPLKHALEVLGADRMLFAIDYPYTYGDADVKAIDAIDLSDADRRKIYHENAERLFGIPDTGQAR